MRNHLLLIALLAGVLLIAGCSGGSPPASQSSTAAQAQPPQQGMQRGNLSALIGTPFSNSPFAAHAFQLVPGPISSDAQTALAGFSFQTAVLPDGSTQASLTAKRQQYVNQTFVVKPGFTLYFVELNASDDNAGQDTDANLLDDRGVVVAPDGTIASFAMNAQGFNRTSERFNRTGNRSFNRSQFPPQ